MNKCLEVSSCSEQTTNKYCATSEPLSSKSPNAHEFYLIEHLHENFQHYYESEEENKHHIEVLQKLQRLVQDWIQNESRKNCDPLEITDEFTRYLCTFGSYNLGVRSKGIYHHFLIHRFDTESI